MVTSTRYSQSVMKTKLLLSLFIATVSQADITLEQDTFAGASPTPMKSFMFIKGDKVRSDNGDTSSVIMDTATGDMITLVHEQKMMIKTNTKELAAMTRSTPATEAAKTTTTVTATGQKEKVDGYDCEIYLSENSGMVVKMWITLNYPNQEKLRDQLKVMAKLADPTAEKQPEVPGIAIKTEFEQSGLKFTTKLVSLKDGPIDDAKFVIPADYKAPGA